MIRDKAINVLKKHDRLYVWLMENGYFDAPAAKSHHGAYKGGLFDHSLAVAAELQNLTDKLGLKWEREESPYLIGLLHDVCKMEDYIYSDDDKIEWNNHAMYSGHGDKSLIMLMGLDRVNRRRKALHQIPYGRVCRSERMELLFQGCKYLSKCFIYTYSGYDSKSD